MIAAVVLMMFLAIYMVVFEDYVCIQTDYISDEEPIYINYFDLFSGDEGFSNQLYDFLLDEKASEEHILYEKIAIFSLVFGFFFELIGVLIFIKKKRIIPVCVGIVLNCISAGVLYLIIKKAEEKIGDSLLGELEIFFGKAVTFDTSSGVLLVFTLIFAAAFAVCSYFYYTTEKQVDSEKEVSNGN